MVGGLENHLDGAGVFDSKTKTRRGRLNRYYALQAVRALMNRTGHIEPRFYWLVNRKGTTYRKTILAELGRLGDRETIREAAAVLCEIKPPTAAAVARVRRARLGDSGGNSLDLANRLIATLNGYTQRYPLLKQTEILAAIDTVRRQVEQQDGSGCEGEGEGG